MHVLVFAHFAHVDANETELLIYDTFPFVGVLCICPSVFNHIFSCQIFVGILTELKTTQKLRRSAVVPPKNYQYLLIRLKPFSPLLSNINGTFYLCSLHLLNVSREAQDISPSSFTLEYVCLRGAPF